MSLNGVKRFVDFRADPVTLARRLLGQRLVRVIDGVRLAGTIVETEAYLGAEDRAAHTFGGRRTARNESMYLPGGHAYVYFTYGMHHCMNVVCGRSGEGVAVLLRALKPTEGLEDMYVRRGKAKRDTDLCRGPGRLTAALGIDLNLDGHDLILSSTLFIERLRQRAVPSTKIHVSRRIGVESAGPWAARPLRFAVSGSPHVSRAPSSRG